MSLLPEKFRTAVGDVAIASAHMEVVVDLVLNAILGFKGNEYPSVMGMRMLDSKLGLMAELGERKFQTKKERSGLARIVSRMKEMNSERNIVIHGAWQPRGGFRLTQFMRNEPLADFEWVHSRANKQPRKVGEARLLSLAGDMTAITAELYKFWQVSVLRPSLRRSIRRRRPPRSQARSLVPGQEIDPQD